MQTWMIVFRLLHIVTGVLWVGGLVMMTVFIMPTLNSSGAAGTQIMQKLIQGTKLTRFLPATGGTAVLAGFVLFYLDMSVAPSWSASGPARTYSIGGLCALAALVIGGMMTARSAAKLGRIGTAISASGGAPTNAQLAEMEALRRRMQTGAGISMALALVAVAAMAVARYV